MKYKRQLMRSKALAILLVAVLFVMSGGNFALSAFADTDFGVDDANVKIATSAQGKDLDENLNVNFDAEISTDVAIATDKAIAMDQGEQGISTDADMKSDMKSDEKSDGTKIQTQAQKQKENTSQTASALPLTGGAASVLTPTSAPIIPLDSDAATDVHDEAELIAALGNPDAKVIHIAQDIVINSEMQIRRSVTITGTHKITFGSGVIPETFLYHFRASGADTVVTFAGVTLDGENKAYGGIGLYYGVNLFFVSGNIKNCAFTANRHGGGIAAERSNVTMLGGTIENCSAEYGGAVQVQDGSFTMSGGTIRNNRVYDAHQNWDTACGGGVNINRGTATMSGGLIDGNIARHGGGIAVTNGDLTMSGGTVSNNNASIAYAMGGGLFLAGSDLTLSDDAIVSGNISAGRGGGIMVWTDPYNGQYGTFEMLGGVVSQNKCDDYGGGIASQYAPVTISGGAISQNTAAQGGGIYTPLSDLTILDGRIEQNVARYGGGMEAHSFTMSGGTINDNMAYDDGGGVAAYAATVSGIAMIRGNTAGRHGGGIHCDCPVRDYPFTMVGGCIRDNTAGQGGGIFVGNTAIIQDGLISGNKAIGAPNDDERYGNDKGNFNYHTDARGGGIYGPIIRMSGGTIRENMASSTSDNRSQGGGVYSNFLFTMFGGNMSENSSSENGGGAYVENIWAVGTSECTIIDGTISNNYAEKDGGGLYINETYRFSKFTLLSGCTSIVNNESKGDGGGVYCSYDGNYDGYHDLLVDEDVTFANNTASAIYKIANYDIPIHEDNIKTKSFTKPFKYLYNNYDVGYNAGKQIFYITFNAKDGQFEDATKEKMLEIPKDISLSNAMEDGLIPTASKEHYHFSKWTKEDGTEFTKDSTFNENYMTLYANYDINQYNVEFVDYDGTVLDTQTVNYGDGATAPASPTRVGYTFTGWDKTFTNITKDLTVKAEYKINTYTVTFVDYDGSILDTQTVNFGDNATAPASPTRVGHTFKGWEGSYTNVTKDERVTAVYDKDVFTVKFVDFDGHVIKNQTVAYGSDASAPANPTRVGYTFAGWDKAFSNNTKDLTVKAEYKINTYTVTFVDFDGTVLDTQTVDYDT
ncbi:MAG: InlB B-repeat-containing protein, partial [Clostridiales Family XIII bacterium]|nr:InlB B-repeat-containing protein [Clostridiales Family XIII bacterium]